MDNPGEILRLCRLCLVKDQVNIPIFEEQGDIRQIFLKISSCLPVKVSRDDQLPKKICDGCSNKLDLFYEFWNTSANAEKTLLSWLGQAGVKDADETISAVTQQIAKPAETQVKQEALEDGHANQVQDSFASQSFEEEAKDESEAPPPKRARRTAAVKAQINITPESDDDDDMDNAEAMTKVEDESEESDGEDKDPSYSEVPGTSADDQAGPSGVGKDGVEAPILNYLKMENYTTDDLNETYTRCDKYGGTYLADITREDSKDINSEQEIYENEDLGNIYQNSFIETDSVDIKEEDNIDTCSQQEIHKDEDLIKVNYRKNNCTCIMCYNPDKDLDRALEDDEPLFFCRFCIKRFDQPWVFKKHMKIHNQKNLWYECPTCSKMLKSKRGFDYHKQQHEFPNMDMFPCKICSKLLKNENILKAHMKTHDEDTARLRAEKTLNHLCTECGKGFSTFTQFKGHIETHNTQKTFECDFCEKTFNTKRNKRRHSARCTKNSNRENYICDLCGKVFLHSSSLKFHKLAHDGTKPLECDVCRKKFLRHSTLRDHKNSHLGLKRYICQFCDKGFSQRTPLRTHIKSMHSKDRPFLCSVCDVGFVDEELLNYHNKSKHCTENAE